jgi:hypothetical protein
MMLKQTTVRGKNPSLNGIITEVGGRELFADNFSKLPSAQVFTSAARPDIDYLRLSCRFH